MDTRLVQEANEGAAAGAAQIPASARAALEARIVPPEELHAWLQPRRRDDAPERLNSPWHRVRMAHNLLITLRAPTDRPLLLRLTTRSENPRFRPQWLRWTFAARRVPEFEGGEGVSAKDILTADGGELQLALLPGETRMAHLECVAALDEETNAGDYPFEVVIGEAGGEIMETISTTLFLRHPPSALLDHLPSLYQKTREPAFRPEQNFENRSFFERMLLGYEDAMQPMKDMLDSMDRFFGPDDAPADFLPWLATWLGLALDENWPQMRRRRLIKEAVELYRWRGTRRSLSRYLEIYAGVRPEINDKPFAGMKLGPNTLLGRGAILGGVPPHTFVVTLAVPDVRAVNETIVRRIIEAEKPAHSAYALNIVERGPETA